MVRSLFDTSDLRLTVAATDGCAELPTVNGVPGDHAVVVLRGCLLYEDPQRHIVASPTVGLFLRDSRHYGIRSLRGLCVSLWIAGEIAKKVVAGGPTARQIEIGAYAPLLGLTLRRATDPSLDRADVERLVRCRFTATAPCKAALPRDQAAVDAIVDRVNQTYDRPLPLLDLTRASGRSMFEACRTFRRIMQTSIHGYRREVRLRHALSMLVDMDLPLSAVAVHCGFANQGHLGNLFKRRFGMTPGEVRHAPSEALERLFKENARTFRPELYPDNLTGGTPSHAASVPRTG